MNINNNTNDNTTTTTIFLGCDSIEINPVFLIFNYPEPSLLSDYFVSSVDKDNKALKSSIDVNHIGVGHVTTI